MFYESVAAGFGGQSAYLAEFWSSRPATPAEWVWLILGLTGNAIFASRFFLQWIHSERHGESKIPTSFWWYSCLGTAILFTYFLHKREIVGMLGNGPQIIPYIRNLMLIYKKKQEVAQREGAGLPGFAVVKDGSPGRPQTPPVQK